MRSGCEGGASHSMERREALGVWCAASSHEGEGVDMGAAFGPRRGWCEAVENRRGRRGPGSDEQRAKSSEGGEMDRGQGGAVRSERTPLSSKDPGDEEGLCVLRGG